MSRSTVKPFRVSPLSWPLDAGQLKGLNDMIEDLYQRLRENDSGFDELDADNIITGTLDDARLENSGVTAGTYGDATHVPQVTVDVKGRVTAAVDVSLSLPATTHNLLSATHPDTVAADPVLGDVVTAQRATAAATNDPQSFWLDGLPSDVLPTARGNGGQEYWLDGLPLDNLNTSGGIVWKRLAKGASGQALVATATGVEWGSNSSTTAASGSPVGAHAQQAGDASITSAAETAVTLATTTFDTTSFFSLLAPTRLTIPSGQNGYYLIHGQATFANPIIGFAIARIYKNGAQIAEQEIAADNTASPATGGRQVSVVASCVAGDYFELKVYVSNTLGASTLKGGATSTFLQVVKMLQSETIGSLLPTATRGSILKGNAAGTTYDLLAVGAANTVVMSDGTDPSYTNRVPFRDVVEGISSAWAFAAGLTERGRTAAIGTWTDFAFAAGNFGGSGAQTWTLTSGDQVTYRYMQLGKTLWIMFDLETTSVGGVADTDLRLTLPGGFLTAVTGIIGHYFYSDNGGTGDVGYVRVSAAGQTYIQLRKRDSSNWTASVNNTITIGTICLEIQ